MVKRDFTHPSSARLICSVKNLLVLIQNHHQSINQKLFGTVCLTAAALATPGTAHAETLAAAACLAVGTITPAENAAVARSIVAMTGEGPAIVKQVTVRYLACIAAAEVVDATLNAALAATVAAAMAPVTPD